MSARRIPGGYEWLPRRADVRTPEPANDAQAAPKPAKREVVLRGVARVGYLIGWRMGFLCGLGAGTSLVSLALYLGGRVVGAA